jgi:glycine betaine/proline transport system permease protein
MFDFPDFLQFSITEPIDQGVAWLLQNLSGFFDAITAVIIVMFNLIQSGLMVVPWFVYVIAVLYLGIKFHGIRQGITLGIMMTMIGVFGLWESMIYTLVIVIISVLVSLLIGLPLGILMAKNNRTQKILKPILDGMQTMPSFVYLIPAVMLFGIGRVPAVFATTIYAVPPLIRLTYLGIKNVDKEVVEAGRSFGSTSRQLLMKIELPQALPTIMTGVNQTTMMAMAMVVISSMIGAEGIGSEVLVSIRRLEVGRGFQAGFAIVFLAIVLDRLLQGWVAQVQGARSNG